MLRLKKIVLLVMFLLVAVLVWDGFTSDAQTRRGGGGPGPVAGGQGQNNGPRLTPLPIRPGVNYTVFDHASHSPDCFTCHIPNKTYKGVKTVRQAPQPPYTLDDRVTQFPQHAACEQCHAIFQFSAPQSRGFCFICHEKDAVTVKTQFPDQRDDQFGTKFPHNVHVGLNAKDYNVGGPRPVLTPEEEQLQAIAKSSGCNECHVKDGKDKKEENFGYAHHAECARCHGLTPMKEGEKPKNEKPYMNDCLGCHKPFMAKHNPSTDIVYRITENQPFLHDKTHEEDVLQKKNDKGKWPALDCKFCHKETSNAKRTQDIAPPGLSSCIPCHNNGKNGLKQKANELTIGETLNLKQDYKQPEPPKKDAAPADKDKKPADKKEEKKEEKKPDVPKGH